MASLRTSPTQLLLNSFPLKLEPKNNTEAIVSTVKTETALIFCCAQSLCVLVMHFKDVFYCLDIVWAWLIKAACQK